MSQFDAELSFAKQLAYEAGKIMLHYFNAKDKGVIIKKDESPVTIAYSIVMVAAGRFDAVVTSGKSPWDLAAAGFIAQEAGAKITDIFGKPIGRWDQDIAGLRAAKPDIYARIDGIVEPVLSKVVS